MVAIRVLIVADKSVAQQGIHTVLTTANDVAVMGATANHQEMLTLAKELRPDLFLLATDLDDPSLTETVTILRQHIPQAKVLLLGDGSCPGIELHELIVRGIAGYILKTDPPDRIITAVRHVAKGQAFFTQEQLARAHHWHQEVSQQWENLTGREREILLLVAEGQSNKQIAEDLTISQNTVGTHVGNLLGKLNADSRIGAAAWAWRHGLGEGERTSGGIDQMEMVETTR